MTSPTTGKWVNFSKEDLAQPEVKTIIDGIYAGIDKAEKEKRKVFTPHIKRMLMDAFNERTKNWYSRDWSKWLDANFGLDLALEFSIRQKLQSKRPFVCSEDMSKAIYEYYINLILRTTILAGVTKDMADYSRFRMLLDKFEYRLADNVNVSYA